MKITSTLSQSGEATERGFHLPNFVYIALRDVQQSQNKEFSQGKAFYEILHFDREKPCSDDISEFEDLIDQQLSQEVREQFAREVERIKTIGVNGKEALINDVPDDLDPQDTTDFQVRVRLPDSTWQQIHDVRRRYIGKWAAPSLVKFVESPFNSRTERISCKRELLEYVRDEIEFDEVESEVARACITGESDRFEGISEVHELLTTTEEVDRWYLDESGEIRSDITTELIKGMGISRKERDDRIKALEVALENEGRQLSPEEIQDEIEDVYGIETPSIKREYIQQMDLDWMGPQITGVKGLASTIKQDIIEGNRARDGIKESSNSAKDWNPKQVAQNMPVYEFLLVDKNKLNNIDTHYESSEAAVQALDEVTEQAHRPDRLGKPREEAHELFEKQISVLKEEGFAPRNGATIQNYDSGSERQENQQQEQEQQDEEEEDTELTEEENRILDL